ncbi:MAG: hypothetical protein WCT19_00945 [Candidatus Paceibacterota bacterium]
MKKVLATASLFVLPVLSLAQTNATKFSVTNINTAANTVVGVINIVVMVLVAIAVFWVIWGAFQFVLAAGDEEKRKEGKNKILYGIIGIFIMLSVYGLVNILVNSFQFSPANVNVPAVKLPTSNN